jgi:lysozyme
MQGPSAKTKTAKLPSDSKVETFRSERFRNIALGIAGVVSSVLIPLLGLYYTTRDKDREVSKGFVEIATKILSENPTDGNKPLREWAIALIDNYSSVPLPSDARNALLSKQPIFGGGPSTSIARLQQLQQSGLILGVTVSHFNASVDFSTLKERGIQYAFIKVSQGASSIDNKGADFARAAKQSGLQVGLYHVFIADADPDAQLTNFANRLTSVQWDIPPTIDCEVPPGTMTASDYATRVERLATQLHQRFGVKPIIYTATSFAIQHLDQRVSAFPLFVAQFGSRAAPAVPKWWTDYVFWHLAEGVNDDPALRGYDIVAFKGQVTDLAALAAGRK